MKILKVAFKNINSLQGSHEIDFQENPFRTHNLFAITGPTGSGKTTILDVIVLALFNEIPRFGRVSKKEIENKGAILTRGQKEAYARVTYSCSQGIFTSEWSISTARTGNLRDYDMYLNDALTGDVLIDKKSEVPAKNEELIGLKYDQFVKSVMLAQGAFAEFLRVPKKERSALLEKITGTVIYRKIGIKVYEKYRTIKNTIGDLEKDILNWQNELLAKDEITTYIQQQKEIKTTIDNAQKEEKTWLAQIEHKTKILNERNKLKSWVDREKDNQKAIDDFQEKEGLNLERHKKVEPIQPQLYDWHRLQKETLQLQQELKDATHKQKQIEAKKIDYDQKITKLLGEQVEDADYDTALAAFERKVLEAQNLLNRKKEQGTALKKEIEADLRPLSIALEKSYAKTQENLLQLKQEANHFFDSNKANFKQPESSYDDVIDQHQITFNKLQQARSLASDILKNQQFQKRNEAEIEKLKKLLLDIPQQISEHTTTWRLAEKELKNLELTYTNQQLVATLEEHRAHLVDGKPCPLCGALEHPYSENIPVGNDDLSIKIEKEKQKIQELNASLNKLKTTLNLKQETLDTLTKENKALIEEEQKALQNFKNNFSFDLRTDWQREIENVQHTIKLLKQAKKYNQILEVTEIVMPKMDQILSLLEESINLRNQLRKLFDSDKTIEEVVAQLEREWRDIQSEKQLIISSVKSLKANQIKVNSKLNPLEDEIKNHLALHDLDKIQEAYNALLSYDELQVLEKQKDTLFNQKQEIQINKDALNKMIDELRAHDVSATLDELKIKSGEIQKTIKDKQEQLERIKLTLLNQKKFEEKIEELQQKIAQENKNSKHWQILNELVGDATGNKFNTFAQDLTLAQLLQLANQRLMMLSDRYLVANPTPEEDDSLVVIDKDMGGQRRSVKTLSGGETFVISLALALALSDLASHKVQIQSLFIDEGFGTLDPETLDQTLNTLEQLQEEDGKMIGIISHVTSLKERITTQIQVTPNGRGFSTLRVVG